MPLYVNRTLQESIMKNDSLCITLKVIDNHNMVEEIRVSIIIIKISNVNMYILCDLKGRCLNYDHVAHVYEYIGAECSKLRQLMRAIFTLSHAQLLLLVVMRSRDLSRECHVTKHKTPRQQGVTSHCPILKISGPFNSAHRALQVEGCAPKILKKGRTLIDVYCSMIFIVTFIWLYQTALKKCFIAGGDRVPSVGHHVD